MATRIVPVRRVTIRNDNAAPEGRFRFKARYYLHGEPGYRARTLTFDRATAMRAYKQNLTHATSNVIDEKTGGRWVFSEDASGRLEPTLLSEQSRSGDTVWRLVCDWRAAAPHQRKAERFIQTMLREWAYAATYRSSEHRRQALGPWVDYYNHQRPHGALGHNPPASRLHAD